MKHLIFLILFAFNAGAEIVESNRYADVLKYLDRPGTLFVTDLDNTVLMPAQTLGSDQWGSAVQKDLVAKGYSKEMATDLGVGLFALVQMKTKVVAVEAETPAILEQIARRGITTLGLTARPLNIMDRTLEQTSSINAGLTGLALNSRYAGGTVAYKNGIIFVGPHNNKGEVLKEILEKSGVLKNLKRVVFIDDKAHHTEAVNKVFTEAGVDVIAIRYGAADDLVKNFDAALAQRQFEIFMREGRIVSDADARR